MSYPQVAITGFAINSSIGTNIKENLESLQAGRSGIVSGRALWEPFGMRSWVMGNIRLNGLKEMFDRKQLRFMCEPALLIAAATKQAIEHAGLSEEQVQSPDTGIVLGTGAGASANDVYEMCARLHVKGAARLGAYYTPIIMGSSPTANVGSVFKIHGHSYTITSACATSAHAIMLGADAIRLGRQKTMIVGGGEDINPYSAASFEGMNALSTSFNDTPERSSRPLDRDRDGFVFSGGAGVLILEELEAARKRGAEIYAIVGGAGATCDGEEMVAPNGYGAERSMRQALQDAQVNPDQVGYVNLHGTSTPLGDVIELEAVKRVFGSQVPPFSSTKSMTGHALGAAGAQEAIFCILMMREKFLAANINLDNPDPALGNLPIVTKTREADIQYTLTNSFGFGGTNCSLLLKRP